MDRGHVARGVALASCALLCGFALPAWPQAPPPLVSITLFECENATPRDTAVAECKAVHKKVSGLKVGVVSISGPWSRRTSLLPLKAGDALTPESLFPAMEALRDEITKTSSLSYLKTFGQFEVLYIGVNYSHLEGSPTVDVEFIPRYVNVSLVKVGDNVLPLPRPSPPPFEDVSKFEQVLKPSALAAYDQAFGTSVTGAIDTDVPLSTQGKLNLAASGRFSLGDPLHEAKGALGYHWQKDEGALRAAGASVSYEDDRTPLASNVNVSDAWAASGQLMWKLAANTRLYLDAIARDANERLTGTGATDATTPEKEQRARVLFESIPRSGGFVRASLWAGTSSAGGSVDTTHQTSVLRLGWAREFSVAPSQTIGLEMLAGAGHIWGTAPAYDRFYGGNTAQKFLYDSSAAKTMTDMPSGPLLRSFGEGAAAINAAGSTIGGTGFWHLNIGLTIPIAPWSKELIPNEGADLPDADGNDMTLKQVMAKQVDVTGPSFLESALVAQGMAPEQAQARTREVMDEIRPAAHYIINDASLIAIKPLLMLDAAGLSAPEGSENWMSVGLGLQVTVVTAKFEAGYNQTIHGPTFGKRGAPFARLVFQRLF